MLTFERNVLPGADDNECSWMGWSSKNRAVSAFTGEIAEASEGKGDHTGE